MSVLRYARRVFTLFSFSVINTYFVGLCNVIFIEGNDLLTL